MAATLCRPFGSELQCMAGIFVLFGAFIAHVRLQPYRRESLNRSEFHSLIVRPVAVERVEKGVNLSELSQGG